VRHRAALFIAVGLALAACAERSDPPPPPPPNPYVGTRWVMAGGGADAPTIDFSNSRAGGHTGCNSWFAQVTSNDPALSFSAIGTTRRMCEAELMQVERSFVAALRDTQTARVEDGALMLLDINGVELARFEPAR
jgi:heat shock protein HslJ